MRMARGVAVRADGAARVVVVAGALALLASGCGGGSSSPGAAPGTDAPPTTTSPAARTELRPSTFDRWTDAALEICDRYVPQMLAVVLAFGEVESDDDLVDFIDAIEPIESAYMSDLLDLEPPIERRREVDRVLELSQAQLRALTRFRDALAGVDRGRLVLAAEDIERQSWELYRRMTALGLDDCGYAEDVVTDSVRTPCRPPFRTP